MTYVYFISNERKTVVKIGVANKPMKRLKTFQTAHYEELIILKVIKVSSRALAFKLEVALHQKFKKYHIRGEWFKLSSSVRDLIENYEDEKVSLLEHLISYLSSLIVILGVVLIGLFILK